MNETTELIMKQLNSKKVHAETHELGGGDEIDALKLKNIGSVTAKTISDPVTSSMIAAGAVGVNQLDPSLITSVDNVAVQAEFDKRGINVQKYGAKGDGTTDDTAAIQAAINAAGASGIPLLIPNPNVAYRITDTLIIGFYPGLIIRGASWEKTIIRMDANNKPIFKTFQQDTHSVQISDLRLSYTNNQSSATHPNSYGIAFENQAGNANGLYHWIVSRIKFIGCTVGIGVIQSTGILPIWGCKFQDLLFSAVTKTAIDLRSPSPSGLPCNELRNIKILNQGSSNSSWAIALRSECLVENVDIEDWVNGVIFSDTSENLQLVNIHIERHTFNTEYGSLMTLSGYNVKISGLHYQGGTLNINNNVYFYDTDNSTVHVIIENVRADYVVAGGKTGTARLIKGSYSTRAQIHVKNVQGVNVYYGYENTPSYIKTVDGIPLRMSAAPTNGTYSKGDIVYNQDPDATEYLGWICTVAGTPGTWKGFGAIQA